MENLFNEEVMLKLISMLEGATVWGALAVIIYFLIPVFVAFIQFGFGVWAVKFISEGVRDLFIGVSGGKGIVQRKTTIKLANSVITDCEGTLYAVIMTAQAHASEDKGYNSEYFHKHHVDWLRNAVEEKSANDKKLKAVS